MLKCENKQPGLVVAEQPKVMNCNRPCLKFTYNLLIINVENA